MRPFDETSIEISPEDFEKQVKNLLEQFDHKVKKFEVIHDDKINTQVGEFQIDIKVIFEFLGVDFIVLVECKRYNSAIKRETIQILRDKVQEIGAHKGILVSASGFQIGAIEYSKTHGIALARIINGELTYETKSKMKPKSIPDWINLPEFVFFWIEAKENDSIGTTNLNSEYIKNFENQIFEK